MKSDLKLFDNERLPESPLTDAPEADDFGPRKYVGDVDLPGIEEPLLKELRRRFVLSPFNTTKYLYSLWNFLWF
jgi:hypothetical protein